MTKNTDDDATTDAATLRRLEDVIDRQKEMIDGLVRQRDEVADRADAALDVVADVLARIERRLGITDAEDGSSAQSDDHEHAFHGGHCECGASVFLGSGQGTDPTDDDHAATAATPAAFQALPEGTYHVTADRAVHGGPGPCDLCKP